MKLLKLRDHARTLVYNLIVSTLKADPVLKATISPEGWRTYTEDDNATPMAEDSLPWIEVMPFGLGAQSESHVKQSSPMGIAINIACEGLDVRDALNLWGAVENAIFTGDGSRPLGDKIRVAMEAPGVGAHYATIRLTSPAISTQMTEKCCQVMTAGGTLTVEMLIKR